MAMMTPLSRIKRVNKVIHLFDADCIVENASNMDRIIPARTVHRSGEGHKFIESASGIPESFPFQGEEVLLEDYHKKYWTTGMIVIKDNEVLYEKYYHGFDADTKTVSWSVNKSFISAMVGIAIDEGLIAGLDTVLSDVEPLLQKGGYNGLSLKQVLQMTSGVKFDEDYDSFSSDINKMGRRIAFGNSLNHFAAHLKPETEPGIRFHYVSMDTQAIAMTLRKAVGCSLSEYLEKSIWSKMGMSNDAKWCIDNTGMEIAFGMLNVCLRDYARFGCLYANGGYWNGHQIIPEQWLHDSITVTEMHLMPGPKANSEERLGYGYHWWIPEEPDDDFMALGLRGQVIYVNPKRKVVIVKTSADPFWTLDSQSFPMSTAFCQHIAKEMSELHSL